LEEKITYLSEHHEVLLSRRSLLEGRVRDARSMGKEVAAQHVLAEISVNAALIIDNTSKIKDLQREVYFISLERKRKQGIHSIIIMLLNGVLVINGVCGICSYYSCYGYAVYP